MQRNVLAPQIQAFLDATSDTAAREVYGALQDAVQALSVPVELAGRLGAVIEIALASGRVRRLFGAGAELSLAALFRKTPQGRELAAVLDSVNQAFAQLEGQTVESLSATLRAPGAYALTIKTSGSQIVLRFDQTGVRVENVEVNLK